MNFVEKHSKLLAVTLCLCAFGPVLSTVHAYEVQPGWHEAGATSYYILDNHQKAKGLTEIDGKKYYFGNDGSMRTGWANIENTTYYFDNSGEALTGKSEIQGVTYNFQENGTLESGWTEEGTYNNEKGFKVANAWVNDDSGKAYLDENGTPVKSTFAEIEGSRYYFNDEGKAAVGTVDVDGTTYYTDDQGIVKTGWQNENGATTYYNEDGSLNTDTYRDIDGQTYAFNEDGTLLTNSERDGYTIDESGVVSIAPAPVEQPAPEVVPEAPAPETTVEEPAPLPEVEVPAPEVEAPAPEVEAPAPEVEVPAPDYSDAIVEDGAVDDYYQEDYLPDPTPEVVEEYVPEEVVPEVPVEQAPIEVPVEQIPVETPVEQAPVEVPVETPSYDKASSILGAALSQIGVNQDCTMLVTNSLAAVGISFHGWPEDYAALGDWTSNPVPGDIIIYSGHVAVYAGDGMAVHGGWNGYTTAMFSVNCSRALIGYIHVR